MQTQSSEYDSSKAQSFVKSLRSGLYSNGRESFILKRATGYDMEDNIRAYLAFLKMAGGLDNISKHNEDIYYLVACMFYKIEIKTDVLIDSPKYIRFEDLIARLYKGPKSSDSMRRKIATLLDSDYDPSGVFVIQLLRLLPQCKSEIRSNERVDYVSLLKDLEFWNVKNKRTRLRWAERIAG